MARKFERSPGTYHQGDHGEGGLQRPPECAAHGRRRLDNSQDGERIASGSADNTIRITWVGRDKKQLIERARERLPREMTAEEKRRFYLAVD
ncbi:MAG: hypothetical protein ACRBM6_08290 [Geminicoccales bacterium]